MKKIIVIGISIFLLGGIYYFYDTHSYERELTVALGKEGALQEITITKGASLSTIASQLEKEGLIHSSSAFVRYIKSIGMESKLASGTYTIDGIVRIEDIADVLLGKKSSARLRIQLKEGETIRDLEEILIEKELATKEEIQSCLKNLCSMEKDFPFLKGSSSLEGYLFPDTYYVTKSNFTMQSLARQMLANFEKKVVSGMEKELNTTPRSLKELITMASIVEKESRPKDDQSIVAGILWKRLDNNVQLATDATNRYIKKNPLAPITIQELTSNNPYNTRKVKGLPPTAISNPGLASIRATLTPKSSDYWYYLHDNEGMIHFARTENEHNRNKSLYLQ